eukprot:199396-Chlamydomonas_euryale.AAC.2
MKASSAMTTGPIKSTVMKMPSQSACALRMRASWSRNFITSFWKGDSHALNLIIWMPAMSCRQSACVQTGGGGGCVKRSVEKGKKERRGGGPSRVELGHPDTRHELQSCGWLAVNMGGP